MELMSRERKYKDRIQHHHSDGASDSKGLKESQGGRWISIAMKDLKEVKQVIVTYGLYSTFFREMIRIWASSIKTSTHDRLQLVSALLNDGPQLIFK